MVRLRFRLFLTLLTLGLLGSQPHAAAQPTHNPAGATTRPYQLYVPPPFEYSFNFDIVRADGTVESTLQEVYMQLASSTTGNNPLLLAFHGKYYDRHWTNVQNVNNLDTQLHQLMDEASRRGWITVSIQAGGTSSAGPKPFSYGNPEMDQRVTAVIEKIENVWGIRDRRIYTIGHSMGGCDAVNYAARHQDPYDWRIAAAWSWSGVLDVTHLDGDPLFFWANGNYSVDPLPYLAASSIKADPIGLDLATCGALGTNHDEDLSQIFNAAEIPIMITHADSDICEAISGVVTTQHFQTVTGELPLVSFDTSFNNNHATAEDFDAVAICDFFSGNLVSNNLPSKGYKTVAVEDGRYGYFDVTLANALEPGVFGWEFITTGLNALALPLPTGPQQDLSGVSELRMRVDDPSGRESPLVSDQWLFISVPNTTEPITFVLENFLDAPGPISLNGGTANSNYDPVTKVLTLGPAGPGQLTWEVQP